MHFIATLFIFLVTYVKISHLADTIITEHFFSNNNVLNVPND